MQVVPFAAATALALAQLATTPARANVVYDFVTTSMTVRGAAVDGQVNARIVLADGVTAASVATPEFDMGDQTIDGVVSASLGWSLPFTPEYRTDGLSLISFTATVSGEYLDIATDNYPFGFFADFWDTSVYWGVAGPGHLLTIGFGTDDGGSPCYGGANPLDLVFGAGCVATGYFIDPVPAPEPSTMMLAAGWIMLIGLGVFGRRRG